MLTSARAPSIWSYRARSILFVLVAKFLRMARPSGATRELARRHACVTVMSGLLLLILTSIFQGTSAISRLPKKHKSSWPSANARGQRCAGSTAAVVHVAVMPQAWHKCRQRHLRLHCHQNSVPLHQPAQATTHASSHSRAGVPVAATAVTPIAMAAVVSGNRREYPVKEAHEHGQVRQLSSSTS